MYNVHVLYMENKHILAVNAWRKPRGGVYGYVVFKLNIHGSAGVGDSCFPAHPHVLQQQASGQIVIDDVNGFPSSSHNFFNTKYEN